MQTIKQCILDKIHSSNPCDLTSLKNEVFLQQTEIKIDREIYTKEMQDYTYQIDVEEKISISLEELIKDNQISIGICGNKIVFDFPRN